MRNAVAVVAALVVWCSGVSLQAEERKSDRIVEGVLTGLLGGPQQPPNTAYAAQEREQLVSLLQSGEYVTSRQGETIDQMV